MKKSMSSRRMPTSAPKMRPPSVESGTEAQNVPLYLRVAFSLRSRINNGEWPPGSQLPIIKDLARQYNVALITVRQAIRLLSADNLVRSQQGRGTFVNGQAGRTGSTEVVRQAINDRLNLPADCTIRIVRRSTVTTLPTSTLRSGGKCFPEYRAIDKLHCEAGRPFAFLSLHVEKSIYDRFPPKSDQVFKLLKLILDLGPLKLSSHSVQISLTYADERLAKLLKCEHLSSLVRIRTIRCDKDGFIILTTDAYYRGDKFLFEIEEKDIELSGTSPVAFPSIKP